MNVPFVDLKTQHKGLADELQPVISAILERGDFILGEDVRLFEAEFAGYCETQHAVGVSSGTAALELALRAFEIGPGDEVITSAHTFIATAAAISFAGARPVLVDADAQSYNIDVSRIEAAITGRTKAIIPVHLYGQPANIDPILEIARHRGLVVIEDACQAHGARYRGKRIGSLGHAAAFSFYPAKNLGACGDAGAVVTSDSQVAERIRMLRDHGQREKYYHTLLGYNHRLDTLQAAVLRVKLKYLDRWNAARRGHARLYNRLLEGTPVITPREVDGCECAYHLYVIRARDRDALNAHLHDKGIATGIHYPVPIHLQPAYRNLGYGKGSFPVTEECCAQVLSLPMYAELTPEQIQHVVRAIRAFEAGDR